MLGFAPRLTLENPHNFTWASLSPPVEGVGEEGEELLAECCGTHP